MPVPSVLAVVFVGVAGNHAGKVDAQIQAAISPVHVQHATVSPADLRTLARHGEGSREIVERLHAEGVIAAELVGDKGHLSLHYVVYAADGHLRSYNEMSLVEPVLTTDELGALRDNLTDEVASLTPEPAPAPVATPRRPAPPAPASSRLAEIDFEAPVAKAAPRAVTKVATPTPPVSPPVPARPVVHEEAPPAPVVATADADAVRPEDLEAMTGGEIVEGGGGPSPTAEALHLGVDVGLGMVGRSFSPAPSTVAPYSSSPVGAIAVGGRLDPTARLRVEVGFERTLGMSTSLAAGSASTTITRWEVRGGYALVHGDLAVRAELGLGHRGFAIDSIDPMRSPDGDYNYLIAGASASLAIGEHLALSTRLAFEPVLWGAEPTEMEFGGASRWALDAGVGAELHASAHTVVRAAVDYQRFSWSWDQAGARGAGGAVDGYPSATLSLGAQF